MPTVQVDIVLKTSLQLDLGELKRAIDLSITGSTTGILYETNLISKYQAALSTRSKLFTGRTEQSEFSTPLVTIQIVFQTPGYDSFDNAVTRSIKDTVVDFVTPKVVVTKVSHVGPPAGAEPNSGGSTQSEIADLRLYMKQFTQTLSQVASKL